MRQREKLKLHTRQAVAEHFASSSPERCVSLSRSIAIFLFIRRNEGNYRLQF